MAASHEREVKLKFGFRRKVSFAVFGVTFVVVTTSGYFLARHLEENLTDRIVSELSHHAKLAKLTIESAKHDVSAIEVGDALADRLGEATDSRVTIIRRDGVVTGDSELTLEQVRDAQNHADRKEIIAAFETGSDMSRRFSDTIETEMLYLTTRYSRNGEYGVIRVSRPLSEVSKSVSTPITTLAVVAVIVGLLLSLLVSTISSQMLSGTLRTLVNYAMESAKGKRSKSLEISFSDELGGLAGSLNRLSEQLERHVATLAEERDRFEAVLNGMNDAVLALDEKQRVTLINRAAIMLLELGHGPIGQTLLETIRVPELHDLVVASANGSDSERTAEFDLPGKKTRRILARATARKTGVVVVLLDVTELRRLESLRKDFVSNVSHELRTPVSIVRAGAETLLGGAVEDPEAATKFLNSILTNAERLSNIIADLLDLSRIEAGKYELAIEPISVSLAMKRAAAALETHAIEKNFTIKVESESSLSAMGDARTLDQILFNFTDNAVKYAGTKGRVTLRATKADGKVRVEVEDDGPGIEPKHRERLFERFYRVDPGRSREMGGTGLGLAIVKHLATVMSGEVGMDPAEPTGSIFWVLLKSVETDEPHAATD